MGLLDRFYRVPHDLRHLEREIGKLAVLMDAVTPPGMVRAARDEVTRQSIQVRARLAAQGRLGELRRFRTRVLASADFMDGTMYHKVFVPYIETILPRTPGE
ncbi:hypothetical protein L6E12_18505 [Actinokineospora sp. PR83]|uniref:hypothetical protein n=1 Tax=Actinokineospora sp. PR83 TaxID=2884908 RepID=UPI001F48E1E2|nr:hypothetical protein [Actinokineospora sp. PR83]MCG8917774.1 hypothetical protein [Actinokineospora sp. PR83]